MSREGEEDAHVVDIVKVHAYTPLEDVAAAQNRATGASTPPAVDTTATAAPAESPARQEVVVDTLAGGNVVMGGEIVATAGDTAGRNVGMEEGYTGRRRCCHGSGCCCGYDS